MFWTRAPCSRALKPKHVKHSTFSHISIIYFRFSNHLILDFLRAFSLCLAQAEKRIFFAAEFPNPTLTLTQVDIKNAIEYENKLTIKK